MFVNSVINGLRFGFWPPDESQWTPDPKWDKDNYPSNDPRDPAALRAYADKEIANGHWSQPLTTLFPYMTTSPMFVVWQGDDDKARVIMDHTGSGLNDGISAEQAKIKYDDMHPFALSMRYAKLRHPNERLVCFKSDVKGAFLNLPAHPIWQLRQVVKVESVMHIVRCLILGSRPSPRLWCSVSGLINWIAVRKLRILSLHVFMDDFFGWDRASDTLLYRGLRRPRAQVSLLILWEFINCPNDDSKQIHGEILTIIGFEVAINEGSISLSSKSRRDITERVQNFLDHIGRNPPLHEWQKLVGHLNWLLNVLPLVRPALSEMYRKMGGKSHRFAPVTRNATIEGDLRWLLEVLPRAIGIRFVGDGFWDEGDADAIIYTDASGTVGLSFVYANNGFYYPLRLDNDPSKRPDIFFLELVAILSSLHHVASLPNPPRRILVFTDSLDSVQSYNSLRSSTSMHNGPILGIAKIILETGIDVRISHVAGKKNVAADLLSRLMISQFQAQFPSHKVRRFEPSRALLPAKWGGVF